MYAFSKDKDPTLYVQSRYGWVPLPISSGQRFLNPLGVYTNKNEIKALKVLFNRFMAERQKGFNYFDIKNATTYIYGKKLAQAYEYTEISCDKMASPGEDLDSLCRKWSMNLRGFQKKVNNKLNRQKVDWLRKQYPVNL